MRKIVVVSDSHGMIKELENIYSKFKDEASQFVHCGDSELDVNHSIFNVYKVVRGNCDYNNFKKDLIINAFNKRILITHGHYHNVKFNLDSLYNYALEKSVDIVCFGHTHYPIYEVINNIKFINPGSLYANRGIRGKSFAVIEFENEKFHINFLDATSFKKYI